MSQINPFAGAMAQSPQVQRQQSAERDRLVRKARETEKNVALTGDQLEHQVENSEAIVPIQKDHPHERRFKRSRHTAEPHEESDEGSAGLDVTA